MKGFMTDKVDKDCLEFIINDKEPSEPERVPFLNYREGCEMLHKHLMNMNMQSIGIHADVDFDGVASSKIMNVFLEELGQSYIAKNYINGIREHGLKERHIEFINNANCQLLIVVDSASNDIDIIKQLNCDVLVLDHHKVEHTEYTGDTVGGRYIIINNTVSNLEDNYTAEDRMSGAEVVYEFIRQYEFMYNTGALIENRNMYEWVGVSLYTDVIALGNIRNQYYIGKTVNNMDIEQDLSKMLKSVRKWATRPNKSNILFQMAPVLNRAIRAGASSIVLNIVLNAPSKLGEIDVYSEQQKSIVDFYKARAYISDSYAKVEIAPQYTGYSGVIASAIKDQYSKTSIAYQVVDGIAIGSARGKISGKDYRQFINSSGYYAQGHNTAFGFRIPIEELDNIISSITNDEVSTEEEYVVAGKAREVIKSKYSIDRVDTLMNDGTLWELGVYNSRVSEGECIKILADKDELSITEEYSTYMKGEILGVPCVVFSIPTTKYIYLYIEYSSTDSMVKVYIRECPNYK